MVETTTADQAPLISFDSGSLVLNPEGVPRELMERLLTWFRWDARTKEYRCLGSDYAEVVMLYHRSGFPYRDAAREFQRMSYSWEDEREMRAYQGEALQAWQAADRKGVVVLPTGAGKSFVAMRAIYLTQRSALVVVPTLDLVNQWVQQLSGCFALEIGIWGGGEHRTTDLTVSTYDSAQIHMEREGGRFGMLVFDECHHLPGPSYRWIAKMAIAPFRLGLTATPERSDGGEALLCDLVGPICHRVEITSLRGNFLSEYETELLEVPLEDEEWQKYETARQLYLSYVRDQGVDFSSVDGWQQFMAACFKSDEGKKAYGAYLEQKRIIRQSQSKLKVLWGLLWKYRGEQVIVFTNDNETAYTIGERFCLPVLTHQTKLKERKKILEHFKQGLWPWIVTSKVLNEGVDVPRVNVGIVVSGSGSVREHVQRLGRILRRDGEKSARLIELVSKGTSEQSQSLRRRDHLAYRSH